MNPQPQSFWDFVSSMQNPQNQRPFNVDRRGRGWGRPAPRDRQVPDWTPWADWTSPNFFGIPLDGRVGPPPAFFHPPPPPTQPEVGHPAPPATDGEKTTPRAPSPAPSDGSHEPLTPPESIPEYFGPDEKGPPPPFDGEPGPSRGGPHRHGSHHHGHGGPPGLPHRGRRGPPPPESDHHPSGPPHAGPEHHRRGSPHHGPRHCRRGPPPHRGPHHRGHGPPPLGGHGPFGGFDPNNIDLNGIARFFATQLGIDPETVPNPNTSASKNAAPSKDNDDGSFTPAVDTFYLSNRILIHASVPGAKKSDINVSYDPASTSIDISGVIQRPAEIDSETYGAIAQAERQIGLFKRRVALELENGWIVDEEGISAKLEDGVLRVEVPKMEEGGWTEVKKVDIA